MPNEKEIWENKKLIQKIYENERTVINVEDATARSLYFNVVDENDKEYRKHFGIKKAGKPLQLVIPKSTETFTDLINTNLALRVENGKLKKENEELKASIKELDMILQAITNPKKIVLDFIDEKFIL